MSEYRRASHSAGPQRTISDIVSLSYFMILIIKNHLCLISKVERRAKEEERGRNEETRVDI